MIYNKPTSAPGNAPGNAPGTPAALKNASVFSTGADANRLTAVFASGTALTLSATSLLASTAATSAETATAAETPSLITRLWDLNAVLHPLIVHFPIAFINLAALLVVLRFVLFWKRDQIGAHLIYYALWLATLSGIGACVTGWAFAQERIPKATLFGLLTDEKVSQTHETLFYHRWIGIISTVAMLALAIWGYLQQRNAAQASATSEAPGDASPEIDNLPPHLAVPLLTPEEEDEEEDDPIAGNENATRPPFTALWQMAVLMTTLFIGLVGHWGGALMYGDGFVESRLFAVFNLDWEDFSHKDTDDSPAPASPSTSDPASPSPSVNALPSADEPIVFETHIAPIFVAKCLHCHGPRKQKGDYRMDTLAHALGDEAIVPKSADVSYAFELISTDDKNDIMPPEKDSDPLSQAQIDLIARWINEGAHWPDGYTLEEK